MPPLEDEDPETLRRSKAMSLVRSTAERLRVPPRCRMPGTTAPTAGRPRWRWAKGHDAACLRTPCWWPDDAGNLVRADNLAKHYPVHSGVFVKRVTGAVRAVDDVSSPSSAARRWRWWVKAVAASRPPAGF